MDLYLYSSHRLSVAQAAPGCSWAAWEEVYRAPSCSKGRTQCTYERECLKDGKAEPFSWTPCCGNQTWTTCTSCECNTDPCGKCSKDFPEQAAPLSQALVLTITLSVPQSTTAAIGRSRAAESSPTPVTTTPSTPSSTAAWETAKWPL